MYRLCILLAIVILQPGCAVEPVKPWDRDLLAQPQMQLIPNPLDNQLDQHIYFSKEAASGGQGVGGGGCGCN